MKKISKITAKIKNSLMCEKVTAYKTVREAEKWWALLAFVIPLPFFLIYFVSSLINNNLLVDSCLVFVISYLVFTACITLYCWSFKPIQDKFRRKGKKYSAKIFRAEEMFSANGENTYYLFIEFYVDNERLIRRTCGYVGNPNFYLDSTRCYVYEINGKYVEADFKLRDLKKYNERLIKITKHKMFMPKGDKYV